MKATKKAGQRPLAVSVSRIEWLRKQMRTAWKGHAGATRDRHWSAVATFLRELRTLRKALDAELLVKAEARVAEEARILTDEERAVQLAGLVDGASDGELEVCMAEWLRRRWYRMGVDAGGSITITPLGESLQLVPAV